MKNKWYHIAFVVVVATVFAVLKFAPPVKTPRLPATPEHADRKDYGRCPSCHGPEAPSPMPASGDRNHFDPAGALRADHVKCYFCHKPVGD